MRQIFVDLDGVLADFDTGYEQMFGFRPDKNRPHLDPPDFWDKVKAHGSFYANLPIMSDALTLWHELNKITIPIILTGLPKYVPEAADQKRNWVSRHIDKKASVICCRSEDKRDFGAPGDILIDDWDRYMDLWEDMGGIFILHRSAERSIKELDEYICLHCGRDR